MPNPSADNKEEKQFSEIEQEARRAELEARERENQLEIQILHNKEAKLTQARATQQAEQDALRRAYDELIARYKDSEYNKPYGGNYVPPQGMSERDADEETEERYEYEYDALVREAYSKLFDQDNGVLTHLDDFLETDTMSPREMKTHRLEGQKSLYSAIGTINSCAEILEKTLAYKKSDKDPEPMKLLNDLYDISTTLERNYYGRLIVPGDNIKYDDNGKKIHRVVQRKVLSDRADPNSPKVWLQPEIPSSVRGGVRNQRAFQSLAGLPLFDHAPNVSDVEQGALGNCYMVACLSALAEQAPDIIRDSMAYNPNDNTVTVRFYNNSQEPVYVTMDYSLPVWGHPEDDGTLSFDVPFSRRANWVALFEKAYALSGLASKELSDAEKGKLDADYIKIKSGTEQGFLRHMLGKYGDFDVYNQGRTNDIAQENYEVQKRALGHISTRGASYTDGEKTVYNNIRNALSQNKIVAAGTADNEAYPDGFYAGIAFGHAYAVTGAEPGDNGKLYIEIRNPHGTRGREYDQNGRPVEKKHVDGYSKMELRDFVRTFNDYTIANNDLTYAWRCIRNERAETRTKYEKIVKLVNSVLNKNDNVFLEKFRNSEQFKNFRTSALQAAACFKRKFSNPEEMIASVRNMVTAANAYKTYRDNNPNERYNDNARRSIYRYEMASFVAELGTELEAMEAPDSKLFHEVAADDIIKKIHNKGMGTSRAAQAAFTHFRENYRVEQNAPVEKKPEIQKTL